MLSVCEDREHFSFLLFDFPKRSKKEVFFIVFYACEPRRAAPPPRPSAMGAHGSRRAGQRDALPMVGEPSGAPPEPPSNEKTFI